jgi:hypothetical protein
LTESVDQKAGRYLAEGRVAVLRKDHFKASFSVLGSDDDPYSVLFDGDWSCNCQARVLECAHIVACKKIASFEHIKPQSSFSSGDDDITKQLAALFNADT